MKKIIFSVFLDLILVHLKSFLFLEWFTDSYPRHRETLTVYKWYSRPDISYHVNALVYVQHLFRKTQTYLKFDRLMSIYSYLCLSLLTAFFRRLISEMISLSLHRSLLFSWCPSGQQCSSGTKVSAFHICVLNSIPESEQQQETPGANDGCQ